MTNEKTINLTIPASVGELLDKISILKIKHTRIQDNLKLANITKELDALNTVVQNHNINTAKLYDQYFNSLYEINNRLWGIEDKIRELEYNKQFDSLFVETARQVYYLNDKRAELKKQINHYYNSYIEEEKSYLLY